MRGSVASDRRSGRPPQSPDEESATLERPEREENAPEPFEDRHNGSASLGIP
jgi:hypothetical protein